MSKETSAETNLPPAPVESPEAWARLRKDLESQNWAKTRADLESMGLSKKLVPLFAAAVAEETELGESVAAGKGLEDRQRTLQAQYRTLAECGPTSIAEIEKLGSRKNDLAKELDGIEVKLSTAKTAEPQRRHLRVWLAPLFGEKEIDFKHQGALSSTICPPKVFSESAKIQIDPFRRDSWRMLDKNSNDNIPRRVYSTFSAQQPATTTIH
jgi:hypothetical protein